MLNALSLNVGEFFAESGTKKYWYIGKKSLTDGVRECLQEKDLLDPADPQPVLIQYVVTQGNINPTQVNLDNIAFFVTSGFEKLLELNSPKSDHRFSRSLKNMGTSSLTDSTFGINERVDAKGNVVSGIEVSELDFICSKLELLKIQTIAIGFLHSNLNPENENKVANYFKAKAFQVFCSNQENATSNECARWQNTLLRARMYLRQIEVARQLESLRSQYAHLQIECLNAVANAEARSQISVLNMDFAAPQTLEAQLYLGLEGFFLRTSQSTNELKISATSCITSGFFNTPEFSNERISFDPGPMIMGKSFAPCLLDFLYATGAIQNVEVFGLTSLAAERAKPRILESILALVRSNQERKHIDIQKEIQNIEKILAARIWSELLKLSKFKSLRISGPLANSLMKVIKSQRPLGVEISL